VPSNFKVNISGTQTDTDDVFLLRENYPVLAEGNYGGSLYVWGRNDFGQLGQNNRSSAYTNSPIQVGTTSDWKTGTFTKSVLAIKTNGTLWGWGANPTGSLGLNDTIHRSSPVQIGTGTDWKDVVVGQLVPGTSTFTTSFTLAIKTDGTLWGWGANDFGQLGSNNTINRSSPVQIGTTNGWKKVLTGEYCVLALKNDGTLWGWGRNDRGQLGSNNTIDRSSPVQIGSNSNWKDIAVMNHVLAIKTDGTLWGWGFNNFGELGLNNIVNGSSPVQIGTNTDWKKIHGAITQNDTPLTPGHSCAIKTDNTLWVWGYNHNGQLGDNTIVSKSSPIQIGTSTDWFNIRAFNSKSSFGLKTDGSLWTWGNNFSELIILASSPVQIGTLTRWKNTNFGGGVTGGAILL